MGGLAIPCKVSDSFNLPVLCNFNKSHVSFNYENFLLSIIYSILDYCFVIILISRKYFFLFFSFQSTHIVEIQSFHI